MADKKLLFQITPDGYQAILNNEPDNNGFKVKLTNAQVIDTANVNRGSFATSGRLIGSDQITLRVKIADSVNTYSVKELRLVDGYGGKVFGRIYREDGSAIDVINPAKFAVIIANIKLSAVPNGSVTIIDSSESDATLAGALDGHIASPAAHKWSAITDKPNLNTGNGLNGGGSLNNPLTIQLSTPSTITATSTNTATANTSAGHSHAIDKASTTTAGVVQLNNTLTSTSTGLALTAAQGKALEDKKANWGTTASDYKIGDVYTKSEINPLNINDTTTNTVNSNGHTHFVPNAAIGTRGLVALNDTVGTYSLTDAPTMTRHTRDTYKIPGTSANLDDASLQPLALYNFTAGDGVSSFAGFGYVRTAMYSTESQMTQTLTPYVNSVAPKMWVRQKYGGNWSQWGRIDGADFGAAVGETGYIYNKPTTLAGYGITDAINVVNGYGRNSLTVGNSQYPAFRLEPTTGAYSMIMECSGTQGYIAIRPRGSSGSATSQTLYNFPSRNSGSENLALDVATTDQLFVKKNLYLEDLNDIRTFGSYGQTTNVNATNAPNYPYNEAGSLLVLPSAYGAMQFYVTLTGKLAMRNASSASAWSSWRTYTTLSDYSITDGVTTNTQQAISGVKTFSDTTGFSSTKLVGFSSWQDAVRLSGTLPVISTGSFGIGFHAPNRTIYLIDIENQSYLATFNFADGKATFTGALNAAGGLFKGTVEAAYSNVQIQAGTGLTGGGTLATTRALNIDKASAAQLTAGTLDKVLTADIAKPALDAKANSAITMTAGIGLTGGGNLAANRTFSVDKATAAQLTVGTANKVVTTDVLAPFLNKAYVDVTSSRSLGVTYTNNTGYEISVHVDGRVDGGASAAVAYVNGVVVNRLHTISQNGISIIGTFSFVVPTGGTYQVTGMGVAHSSSPYKWVEYR